MSKSVTSTIRIDHELRTAWQSTCEKAGVDQSAISRELIKSAIRYYERNGNLYAPFEMVPGARTPEEQITYTVSASGGVAVNGHGNHVHVSTEKVKKPKHDK